MAIYFYSHGCILSLQLFDIDLLCLAARARAKRTKNNQKMRKKVKLNFQSIFHTGPDNDTMSMQMKKKTELNGKKLQKF